jgi:hypothetical protein
MTGFQDRQWRKAGLDWRRVSGSVGVTAIKGKQVFNLPIFEAEQYGKQ